MPSVNQVELHPLLPQDELRMFDAAHGIVTEAWSPLARGSSSTTRPSGRSPTTRPDTDPGRDRRHLALGNVVIPKSVTPARIAENFDVFTIVLTDATWRRSRPWAAPDGRMGADPDDLG